MSTKFPNIEIQIPDIAAGRVIPYAVEKKVAEDERRNEELELTVEQNEQLKKNCELLEQLCSMKEQELQIAKQDAIKAKKVAKRATIYNIFMLIISLSAWLLPKPAEIIKVIGGWFR